MKKYRVPIFIAIVAVLIVCTVQAFTGRGIVHDKLMADGRHMVLMELFTSQGCSSCPPADALLGEYASAHDAHIIPISFHVDYWNRLGWTDPFSSTAYSERQQWYSRHLPRHNVYTPQLVVNGKAEVVGNSRTAVRALVEKELQQKPTESISLGEIIIEKSALSFHYNYVNAGKDQQLNIALVQKQASTHINAGENEGVNITNHNIVRAFSTVQLATDGTGRIGLPPAFRAADYALVVFVQDKKDLTVLAAAIKDLVAN